jgi:hypothetical protein
MQAWQATVQDEQGNIVVNPSITVYLADGTTLASIMNEDGSPKANPFIGTLDGFVQFWADEGDYKIRGTAGPMQTEVWSVTLDSNAAAEEAVAAAAAAVVARDAAQGFASNASTSASNALTFRNTAQTAATNASTSAGQAATSATNASTSAGQAATSAANATTEANRAQGYASALNKPYVIFAFGQSNMRGFADSVGGDQTSDDGVFFWDAPNGNPVSAGTRFRVGTFGVVPLNSLNTTTGTYANNIAFHAAKRVRKMTGKQVYVIMIARGSMPIESFISDAVLASNGWSRGSNQDLYTQSINALTSALPLVPGSPTKVDAIIGHQGEANMADPPEVYARKMKAALLGFETAGFASREDTVVALGEVAAGGTGNNATRHRAGLYRLKESWNFDKWRGMKIVSSSGLPPASTGNVHFTGGALVSFGHRYAEALFTLQNDREISFSETDYSVDGSLAWATTLAYSSITDYFGRLPDALDFPRITAANSPTLGWCYVAPAGQNTVLGHRQVLRIPYGGVIRIDYEILGLSSDTPTTHQPFCWTWDKTKTFLTSTLGNPATNPTLATQGRRLVSFTFKRPSSPATADTSLPADAEFFSPGLYLGGETSASGAFNILDMRIV